MTRRIGLAWLLLLPLSAGAAGPLTPPVTDGSNLEFSLRVARAKTPLEYGGRTQDTTSRWVGLSLRESAGRNIVLGLYGGYADVTQTNNPLTAGLELDGYHAGVSIHGLVPAGPNVTIVGALEYTYQKVKHEGSSQDIVIDWVKPQAQLGVIVTLNPRWRLHGAATVAKIDGEERARGTVNHTLPFDRGTHTGGIFGIDLQVDADGYIGLEGRTGIDRGGEIYFKRRF